MDLKAWPQFRGTNAKGASENFRAALRSLFVGNGVPVEEADRLIAGASGEKNQWTNFRDGFKLEQ